MGILQFLSKLTGVEEKVKWSRGKKITVAGPSFWGLYNVYVDSHFNVAIFLPKADKTLHILLGNIVEGNIHQKYDSCGKKISEIFLKKGDIEWKINPKNVLYRGHGLLPDQSIYEGIVESAEDFNEEINENWIIAEKNEYLKRILKGEKICEPAEVFNKRIAKNEFARGLYKFLMMNLTGEAIKTTAKELDFIIQNGDDFSKIYGELCVFYMWAIFRTCQITFKNKDLCDQCIDIFHSRVYKELADETKISFAAWMKSILEKYRDYEKAMRTEHPSTPLWVVASRFNENLFGKIRKDLALQMKITIYMVSFMEGVKKLIQQYETE